MDTCGIEAVKLGLVHVQAVMEESDLTQGSAE